MFYALTVNSKYHEMKEKHKARLCWAKHKLDGETAWRDEKIKGLEREFSLCSHSLAKVNVCLSFFLSSLSVLCLWSEKFRRKNSPNLTHYSDTH